MRAPTPPGADYPERPSPCLLLLHGCLSPTHHHKPRSMLAVSVRSSRALRLPPSGRASALARLAGAGQRRAVSTDRSTIELAYERHAAPAAASSAFGSAGPRSIVVAHGLFGSKQNWRSIARAMAAKWGLDVWAVVRGPVGSAPSDHR